jgi:hypothetical protein
MDLSPSGEARFYRPNGRLLPAAPALPAMVGEPQPALDSRLARHGVAVNARETLPSWCGGRVDYNWEIEWLRSRRRQLPTSPCGEHLPGPAAEHR